jgi:hypothetical protein
MLLGYFGAALKRAPRYDDPEFRRFLRRYQWDCVLRGKKAATRRLDETCLRRVRALDASIPSALSTSSRAI